jgi:lipoprotein-anchoring transpeptidase ErfK/SrfK
MVDYYSALLRAVTAPGAGGEDWRYGVYDRVRQMLTDRLRARHPPATASELAAEQSALEAAIQRVESELEWTEHGPVAPERGPIASPSRLRGAIWIVLAVIAAAVGAGGYLYWSGTKPKAAPPALAGKTVSPPQGPRTAANGELAPGVDGGASDPDLAYVFRRQPTFYRTLEPVGTIIIDKLQRFLYLIQPNSVALRYGIAVGAQCADLAGVRHIASMAEWPVWQPPPEMLNHDPRPMPGGPGNPLGARLLQLDDSSSRINGTNAPKTIGNVVAFGCIRLDNDDVVDLYNRVRVSTIVVVN